MTYAGPVPQFGLGTSGRAGEEGIVAITKAIELGYRHIDTAQSYGSEPLVGEAIRRSGIPRTEMFITTKVADIRLDKAAFMPSVEKSLDAIGHGPVDLLLIHWPSERDKVPLEEYVTALAEAKARGFTRHIGVSNFPIALLQKTEALLGKGAIVTNQVEIHPFLQAPKLRDYARSINLPLTAYQPLAKGEVKDSVALQRIAAAHGVTPGAISLAFLMAEGHIVIPASTSPTNLAANLKARDVRLTDADMADIRALDRGYRRINPEKAPRWDD